MFLLPLKSRKALKKRYDPVSIHSSGSKYADPSALTMPPAHKLGAMSRAGTQPCEKAIRGAPNSATAIAKKPRRNCTVVRVALWCFKISFLSISTQRHRGLERRTFRRDPYSRLWESVKHWPTWP